MRYNKSTNDIVRKDQTVNGKFVAGRSLKWYVDSSETRS